MDVKLLGYMPDADPTVPGVIVDCGALVPSLKGMKGAPSAQSAGLAALSAACKGAASMTDLAGVTRVFAGSTAKLEEASGSTWTDRTRASGAYTLGSDDRWRFAQFGNVSLAAAKTEILQSTTAGAFANVGASVPKGAIVETVGQFVFLFDVNDQGNLEDNADTLDRWWCCAKGDHTDWTPDIDTECATGRLTSAPGRIRAGRRFGEYIVVYKERAMYLGVYQETPVVWEFREIPGQVGALCQEAVINVGTPEYPVHIFMGAEDFYRFDGVKPIPIGTNRIKETVYNQLNVNHSDKCISLHDRTNSLIYFYYPVADSVNPDKCVVYNYRTDKWGRDDRQIEAALEFTTPSTTYGELGNDFTTYGDLPSIAYGSSFWVVGFPKPAVFNTSHVLQTLDGSSTTSTLTTGDLGDDVAETLLSRVIPRYLTAPSSASMVNFYRQTIGDSLTTGATTSQSSVKRFDVLREARWHRLRLDFTGPVELPGMVVDLQRQGDE